MLCSATLLLWLPAECLYSGIVGSLLGVLAEPWTNRSRKQDILPCVYEMEASDYQKTGRYVRKSVPNLERAKPPFNQFPVKR